jgi:hypothetical protein
MEDKSKVQLDFASNTDDFIRIKLESVILKRAITNEK